MYNITIPIFIRGLQNLKHILEEGKKFAKEKNFEIENLLKARLYQNMFNLIGQVGYAYFHALDIAEKLSEKKGPELKYNETTIEELQESISKVIEFLNNIKPEDIKNKEKDIMTDYANENLKLPALEYLTKIVLPNFYFHITTTYNILRNNGVPIGKKDYIGNL